MAGGGGDGVAGGTWVTGGSVAGGAGAGGAGAGGAGAGGAALGVDGIEGGGVGGVAEGGAPSGPSGSAALPVVGAGLGAGPGTSPATVTSSTDDGDDDDGAALGCGGVNFGDGASPARRSALWTASSIDSPAQPAVSTASPIPEPAITTSAPRRPSGVENTVDGGPVAATASARGAGAGQSGPDAWPRGRCGPERS